MQGITDADIQELYDHMVQNLEYDTSEPLDWTYSFDGPDEETMEAFGESLGEDFMWDIVPCEVLDEEGEVAEEKLQLMVVARGVYTPADVQRFRDQLVKAAEARSIVIEEITAYEPMDDEAYEAMFGLLDLEDAIWRFRHFEDTGQLQPGEEMNFDFVFGAEAEQALEALAQKLAAAGRPVVIESDAEDVATRMSEIPGIDSPAALFTRFAGKNDDQAMTEAYNTAQALAEEFDAELLGVQFFGDDFFEAEPGDG